MPADLRYGPSVSDRESTFVTGVNGTLMARRFLPAPDALPHTLRGPPSDP